MPERVSRSPKDLNDLGIDSPRTEWWNLTSASLVESAIRHHEGMLAHMGPLVVRTGKNTGRSPNDKYIVRDPESEPHIWWGKINKPMEPETFDALMDRAVAYTAGLNLYVQECFAGADPRHRLKVRVVTEIAWHSLFVRNMFLRPTDEELAEFGDPDFTVLCLPRYFADPKRDGTRSEVVVALNLARRIVLILGTQYAGEIKKSIFSVLNYLLPFKGVFPMHASANTGNDSTQTAIFFGLSGTGKTTLSADTDRRLIGDDEHGWSENGIFNFEGGCYAKIINLSPLKEPTIYSATRKFGTILENIVLDTSGRRPDLTDISITENTRASYPTGHIPNAEPSGMAGHPNTIIMLTADAFGVLPPISRLNPAQAMYHFLSGYTAKVAGTEYGVIEPQATFSTCFAAPFIPLHPVRYAQMLRDRMQEHGTEVWLVNTGWTGGAYGVGHRQPLEYTRRMVNAAIEGALAKVETIPDPVFGVQVPQSCPGVPDEVLQQRDTWADPKAYDEQAQKLARMFVQNFEQFEDHVDAEVLAAGPTVSASAVVEG